MRFPFTFMGVLALAVGGWVILYVSTHRALDQVSQDLALGTAVVCFGFGGYVLIRRVMRGPQH